MGMQNGILSGWNTEHSQGQESDVFQEGMRNQQVQMLLRNHETREWGETGWAVRRVLTWNQFPADQDCSHLLTKIRVHIHRTQAVTNMYLSQSCHSYESAHWAWSLLGNLLKSVVHFLVKFKYLNSHWQAVMTIIKGTSFEQQMP